LVSLPSPELRKLLPVMQGIPNIEHCTLCIPKIENFIYFGVAWAGRKYFEIISVSKPEQKNILLKNHDRSVEFQVLREVTMTNTDFLWM
jgi:hypothetical protein